MSGSGWPTSARPSAPFSCSPRWPAAPGRGEQPGEAIIQTLYPDHYSIQLACRQDYPAFYERELHFRRAMRYPPLVSLINIVVEVADASPVRWPMRRTLRSDCAPGGREQRCACSGRRRRRSAGCAASTARSCWSRARTAGDARSARRRSPTRRRSSRGARSIDVDPLSVLEDRRICRCKVRSAPGFDRRRREADDEHDRAPRARRTSRACDRAARPRRTSRGWCRPNMKSITTIRAGPDEPARREEREAERGDDRRRASPATIGGRAPRTRCARRRADRSGNRFSAVASSPNQAANAIGCRFTRVAVGRRAPERATRQPGTAAARRARSR